MSKRLVGSAATLVQSSYGMSPTMARYMRAQAVAFGEQDSTMTGSQQVIVDRLHARNMHRCAASFVMEGRW